MPSIGPIPLSSGQDAVRYAYGYIDYTVGGPDGAEILFVPGPGVLLRLFFYAGVWDNLTTNVLSFTKLRNDGTGGHVDIASVDVDDAPGGTWLTVRDSSLFAFNLPNADAGWNDNNAYTDIGIHVYGSQTVTGGSITQGSGYLIAEYLSLPDVL